MLRNGGKTGSAPNSTLLFSGEGACLPAGWPSALCGVNPQRNRAAVADATGKAPRAAVAGATGKAPLSARSKRNRKGISHSLLHLLIATCYLLIAPQ
jgi:hypothetical protein